jgi:hypothetical protein
VRVREPQQGDGRAGALGDARPARGVGVGKDEREFLAVRLIDFLINDTDRTPDNYDWARFGEKGNYRWRPVVRDRDRAFTNGNGLINALFVRRVYPKFTKFDSHYNIRGLMQSSYIFDRRLLQRLTAADFQEVARQVQAAVTDDVIQGVWARASRKDRGIPSQPLRARPQVSSQRNEFRSFGGTHERQRRPTPCICQLFEDGVAPAH